MKLTTFLLLMTAGLCQANTSYSQSAHFTLKINNKSVKQVFRELEKNSEFVFFYHDDYVELNRKVNLDVENETIHTILDQLFENTSNGYVIEDNQIIITRETKNEQQVAPVRKRITGMVTDETGLPLIGVNVFVPNTSKGTITNIDGLYVIEVIEGETLEYSYLGYLTKQVKTGKEDIINIVLSEDTQALEEVVIIGYGSQKKASVTSSIASVSNKDITVPTRSLSNGLGGRLAGVYTVQRSGEPGRDDAEFWIRGISTLDGKTSPLILVDGVPRNMNNIEPDEIESFTVLKDAAATAVYGAEGANGVILINTKRGLTAKPVISFRAEYSRSKPTRLPEFVNSWEYLEVANEALMNDGFFPQFSDELIQKYRNREDNDLYPNANWMDELLAKNYDNQRYTLNVRGGTETAKYFVSLAYFNEEGVFKNDPLERWETNIGLKRYNLRSNIDLKVTQSTHLNVDLSGQYIYRTSPNSSTDDIFKFMLYTPSYIFPAVYSDGTIATYPVELDGNNRNPYNLLFNSGYTKEMATRLQATVGITQELNFVTPGLSWRGKVGFDYDGRTYMKREWNPSRYYATGRDEEGNLIFDQTVSGQSTIQDFTIDGNSRDGTRKVYIETSLNYNRSFQEHTIGGLLLFMRKEEQTAYVALPYRKQSLVGRVTYSYDDRYFLEGSFGYNGSETFSKKHRYGFFPAVGIGYYISNEKFYPAGLSNVINKLKLRASYGRTGNDETGQDRFLYRGTFAMNGHNFNQGISSNGGSNGLGDGINELLFENPTIHWEIETKKNIGVDLGFFNNQIELTADYFFNRRSDILLKRNTIPLTAGFHANPWQNYGIIDNWGVDGEMNVRQNFGPVKVTLKGTFTFARNKVIEKDEIPKEFAWQNATGYRRDERKLYIAERLYTNDDFIITQNDNGTYSYQLKPDLPTLTMPNRVGPGDIKFKDLNGDGKIDEDDMSYGVSYSKTPEIVYGFGFNVDYKNFYISAFFQGVAHTQTLLAGNNNVFFPFNWGVEKSNFRTMFKDRWTADDPREDVFMPRLHSHYSYNVNKEESTWWLRDFSFLRFKNLEIGYNIPKKYAEKVLLSGARVYFMGYNLHVWDKLDGLWDPELSNENNGNKYPLPTTFTLGFELNF